jgi:catechol 2,3-dioxygenase-like lactoylglutathione lyase family enzyme
MGLKAMHHLAFITKDLTGTVRFYRDLLGMKLHSGIGHDGYRHYFFSMESGGTVAFFGYDEASPMKRKFPGERTDAPLGFDHVSFEVGSKEELFALKDRLEAADVHVHGAVDHGLFWSIYFYDPNNIPLEATWQFMDTVDMPAITDDEPLDIVAEGADPVPGRWPEVENPTPPEKMTASVGNAHAMRADLLTRGLARYKPGCEPEG